MFEREKEKEMKKTIEQKLRNLFDYQQFENNPELLDMKKQSEIRLEQYLTDEDLASVNAAGEFTMQGATITGNKDKNAGN